MNSLLFLALMEEIVDTPVPATPEHRSLPAWLLVILLLVVIAISFYFIGPLFGMLFSIPFIDGGMLPFLGKMSSPAGHPEIKTPMLVVQTFATFIGLAVGPSLFAWSAERKNSLRLLKTNFPPALALTITALIVVSFMPVNSFFIDWNSHVIFPEGAFADFVKNMESQNSELMKLFTTFDSLGQFGFAIFSISIVAGFSEELCFRGILQPLVQKATGNVHVAIWLTAIIFSAFHLQFFGFVPRMLLGALFGYLYYWSGSLIVPMVAHMINNGIGVLFLYLNQKSIVDFDPDDTEQVPLPVILTGLVIFTLLTVYFYRLYKNPKSASA